MKSLKICLTICLLLLLFVAVPILTTQASAPTGLNAPAVVSTTLCAEDESGGANFRINTATGAWVACSSSGLNSSGVAVITYNGCYLNFSGANVSGSFDQCLNKATVHYVVAGITVNILDKNTLDSACACGKS